MYLEAGGGGLEDLPRAVGQLRDGLVLEVAVVGYDRSGGSGCVSKYVGLVRWGPSPWLAPSLTLVSTPSSVATRLRDAWLMFSSLLGPPLPSYAGSDSAEGHRGGGGGGGGRAGARGGGGGRGGRGGRCEQGGGSGARGGELWDRTAMASV